MRRFVTITGLLVAVLICSVLPASAAPRPNERAKPTIIDFADLADGTAADFAALCGVDVTAEAEGWIKIIPLATAGKGRRQPLELNIYHLSKLILTSDHGTFTSPLDVGPDVIYVEDGVVKVAITGRSTTGSGVIGRVVINTETGEIEHEAGRRVYDDFVGAVCAVLNPGT